MFECSAVRWKSDIVHHALWYDHQQLYYWKPCFSPCILLHPFNINWHTNAHVHIIKLMCIGNWLSHTHPLFLLSKTIPIVC